MESIEKYGDLTDDELLEFLHEIESSDEAIQEAESEANEKIDTEEKQAIFSELSEDEHIEAEYGEDAWRAFGNSVILFGSERQRKACQAAAHANKVRAWGMKQDRIRIQRMAFNQGEVRLSDPITKDNLKVLISLLTQGHTCMIDKYKAFINRRLTILLNPFIPRRIRLCKMVYPLSVRVSPGFLYHASKEFGQGKTFWAEPDIAYYLEQNTEQDLLLANKINFLTSVDKAVAKFHEHSQKRAAKEIQYASVLVQKGVKTYFELLRYNPFWFEILFNYLTIK